MKLPSVMRINVNPNCPAIFLILLDVLLYIGINDTAKRNRKLKGTEYVVMKFIVGFTPFNWKDNTVPRTPAILRNANIMNCEVCIFSSSSIKGVFVFF